MRDWQRRIAGAIVLVILLSAPLALDASALEPNTPAFQRTWERTDQPVHDLTVNRTWMWGPGGFTATMLEPYEEAEDGWRVVQYFDKSRMEDASFASTTPPWDVSNGLLVNELVSGRMQFGNDLHEQREPANVGIAGDPDDASGVTYAFVGTLLDEPATPEGVVINRVLTPGSSSGAYSVSDAMAAYGITTAYFVDTTEHTVASPFWEFMTASGPVYAGGQTLTAPLFENPFYATGLPITEAYWANVKLAGAQRDVLVQCFERRCLTYTPSNSPEWRVEMGNVGQHYYIWRYGASIPAEPPAITGDDALPPAPLVLWPFPETDDQAMLILSNDSPYQLQVTFDGPVSQTLTIDANPAFGDGPAPVSPADCDLEAPFGELSLPPGNYRVSIDFLGSRAEPTQGYWTLVPDAAYSSCYFTDQSPDSEPTVQTTGAVEIATIFYDSPVPDEVSGEYVVLRNVDDHAIQLEGWRIVDDQSNTLTLPDFVLQPAAMVTIHNCTGATDASNLYTGACEAMWNNGGDTATLYDSGDVVIDTYAY